jgi:hypothetical protein
VPRAFHGAGHFDSDLGKPIAKMNRFSVAAVIGAPGIYYVSDDKCKSFNMPQHAVSINFASAEAAGAVAALLNKEWNAFLRNPR